MKRHSILFATLFSTLIHLFAACKGKKDIVEVQNTKQMTLPDTTLVLSYERTACFGTCPVDKIEIKANGEATYYGKVFVDYLGIYQAQISRSTLDSIFTLADEISFFDSEDAYEPEYPISDLPSKFIMLHKPGKKHTVIDRSFAPQEFKKVYNALHLLIKETPWVVAEAK